MLKSPRLYAGYRDSVSIALINTGSVFVVPSQECSTVTFTLEPTRAVLTSLIGDSSKRQQVDDCDGCKRKLQMWNKLGPGHCIVYTRR
jgi:hypothetical protein